MSSLNSVSTINTGSTRAENPSGDKSRPLEGTEQSFGELFGRVFGDKFERQSFAAQQSNEGQPSLRAVFIGSETQVITAGQPPTEEEIMSFAREANLDETSVQALLLTIPGSSIAALGEVGVGAAEGSLTPPGEVGVGAVAGPLTSSGAGGQPGSPSGSPWLKGGLFMPGGQSMATGVTSGGTAEATLQAQVSMLQGSEALDANAAGRAVTAPTNRGAGFAVSVNSLGLEAQGSGQSALEVLAGRSDLEGGEEFEQLLAGRLGLSPKDFSKKQLFEAFINKSNLQEVGSKASPLAQLEPIDLSGMDLGELDAGRDPTVDTPEESRPLSSGLNASLDNGGRSSGGSSDGSSGRADGSGQQPARTLPQQVLQRFGELLGQRLLQQIGQGNWKVEMALEPADLGSIQIELEWRKGELEATFKASHASTRELLQEGLPRLREVLERAGIDVASFYVNDQGRQQSFQGRSGRGSADNAMQSRQPEAGNELEADKAGPKITGLDNGRLDVLV